MDLLNTSFSKIKVEVPQGRVNDILARLQQSGLFRALVTETSGNRVLLDTAFGQLRGVAPDTLTKGDEIYARLLPGKADPTIKIEQIRSAQQALPEKISAQLTKILSTVPKASTAQLPIADASASSALPRIIKVLSHTADKTLIQLENKTFTMPRQNMLEAGETLLLKTSANNKLELLRIQPETILKNALARLLPRIAANQNSNGLTDLQKLVSSVLQLKATDSAKFQTPVPATKNTDYSPSSLTQKETPVKIIQQLITALSRPVARADNFKAESMQQILGMLSLLKPSVSVNSGKAFLSISNQLNELHRALSNSPENFKLLLRQTIETNTAGIKGHMAESALLDVSNSLKTELLQQLEQTITQLQAQKTTIRLHQEQNQPIQFNLNIPLQINDETKALKLKIKQRSNSESNENQHWEINLQFEFGLLGLISTNILLQDIKLSAHFWAENTQTKTLIDSHMEQFKKQLKKSGFELGLFDCFIGKPPSDDKISDSVIDNLVDIKV